MIRLTKTMLGSAIPLALAVAALPAAAEDAACAFPYTPISQIQGAGLSAAITGTVTTQGANARRESSECPQRIGRPEGASRAPRLH
jgi:hypothetical protein